MAPRIGAGSILLQRNETAMNLSHWCRPQIKSHIRRLRLFSRHFAPERLPERIDLNKSLTINGINHALNAWLVGDLTATPHRSAPLCCTAQEELIASPRNSPHKFEQWRVK
jgi:hypothetical protein